jgi:cytochrome c oxidase subunit 3
VAEAAVSPKLLPVGSKGRHASGWWGMLALVVTEAALFAYLLFSYFYIASQAHGPWPPDGRPSLLLAVTNTIILIIGSLTIRYGERGIQQGSRRRLMTGLLVTLVLGVVFLGLQVLEWHNKSFSLTSGVYGSLYFTITGFHMAHVLIGLVMIAVLALWTSFDYFGAQRHAAVSIGAIYWHFVTVVWLAVFATFYVAPYLG